MRSRQWLILTLLALPTLAFSQKRSQTPTQTTAHRVVHAVTEADVVGAWSAELDYPGHKDTEKVGVILWPDHLWVYTGGAFMTQNHGGARWRLVGDTLWLGDDYEPYFHPMTNNRWSDMLEAHGQFGIMDQAIINRRPPYPVSDSIYWSKAFRDTTTACSGPNDHPCSTWVYTVTKVNDRQLRLVAIERLSRNAHYKAFKGRLHATLTFDDINHLQGGNPFADSLWVTQTMATTGVFTRDSLLGCASIRRGVGAGLECARQ